MAVKYSASDKDVLIQILGNHPIIEDKKNDAYNIDKKKKAWKKITLEYNATVIEKRTLLQLKRLWDKIKRGRKCELAAERREFMLTGGGPSKPPPPPQPEIDNLLPYLEYEAHNEDDSDGIRLKKTTGEYVMEDLAPGAVVKKVDPRPSSSGLSASSVEETPQPKRAKHSNKNHLYDLASGRLAVIKQEERHLEELHKVRMEEANYRKEAARLVMLQEEAKLKKILNID